MSDSGGGTRDSPALLRGMYQDRRLRRQRYTARSLPRSRGIEYDVNTAPAAPCPPVDVICLPVERPWCDQAFDTWLETGHYASRPPGELHGPLRTELGCVVLEISFPNRIADAE